MKTLFAAILAGMALAASAADWRVLPDGRWTDGIPENFNYGDTACISWEKLVTLGAYIPDAGAVAAYEAAIASNAQAQAAAALAPLRADHGIIVANGIAYFPSTPNATNGWAFALDGTGDPITTEWYGSPTNSEATVRSNLTTKSATKAAMRADLKAMKAAITNSIAVCDTSVSAITNNIAAINAIALTTNSNTTAVRTALIATVAALKSSEQENRRLAKEQQDMAQENNKIRKFLLEYVGGRD